MGYQGLVDPNKVKQQNNARIQAPKKVINQQCAGYGGPTSNKKNYVQDLVPQPVKNENNAQEMAPQQFKQKQCTGEAPPQIQ